MSDLATVEVERRRGVAVARVAGEIDASNAALVKAQILDGVGNEGPGLVIDLSETGYIDSAGIRALFDTGGRLQVRGMELRVVDAPDSFMADVLASVRMAERYAVDPDADQAVAAVAERMPRQPSRE
jgi:anti-anti-sigma factor